MTEYTVTDQEKKQSYITFVFQALTSAYYPPCAADELEAAAGIIRELGEDADIRSLNYEIKRLLLNHKEK